VWSLGVVLVVGVFNQFGVIKFGRGCPVFGPVMWLDLPGVGWRVIDCEVVMGGRLVLPGLGLDLTVSADLVGWVSDQVGWWGRDFESYRQVWSVNRSQLSLF